MSCELNTHDNSKRKNTPIKKDKNNKNEIISLCKSYLKNKVVGPYLLYIMLRKAVISCELL